MKTIYLKAWSFLLCFTVVFSSISCSKDEASSLDENINIESQILQLVNKHRTSVNLPVLVSNTLAVKLAKEHTLYMIDQGKMSYDNSDERGILLINEEKANKVGENVAYKYKTAQEVMEAWLNSNGHKKNIEGDYTHIGISAIKDDVGHFYYTQIFFRK